ncbi:MAG: hypothetical protein II075_07170 [Bacteroidales bacterium]|jgi:hypothetical protein|nr:hypothetical protein [Bacteroidales bacterium]
MKRLFFVAALCGAVMLGGCMETTYQNKKTNNNSTTTTTTTDENGNTTTTTTDDSSKKKNGKSFHSNNGKFSMDFPDAPQGPIVSEETNKAGMVQVFQYIDQVSNNAMYIAMYKDYPKGVITDANVEDKLKLEANAFLKNFGAKAGSTSAERLGGNKGLSFAGTLNDTIKINMRSYFVGKRYYLIGTIAANSEISDKDSKKFINSFELD